MSIRYEDYYFREDVKLRLIGYGKCNTTTITFTKDKWSEEVYIKYLNDFKANKNIHKIVKVENGMEEVLLDRTPTICSENK